MKRSAIFATLAAMLVVGCAGPGEVQRADLSVTMTGLQEVPGPGDPDGTGTAEIHVNVPGGEVCWNVYARQIDAATAAHIHEGAAGSAGPPVLTLTTPDSAGRSQGCATVDAGLARAMAMQAFAFYVNIHNAAYPAGAIRGQLRGGGAPARPQRRADGQ
jgi:hypothetical protein